MTVAKTTEFTGVIRHIEPMNASFAGNPRWLVHVTTEDGEDLTYRTQPDASASYGARKAAHSMYEGKKIVFTLSGREQIIYLRWADGSGEI